MKIRIDNETQERIPRQHVLARVAQGIGRQSLALTDAVMTEVPKKKDEPAGGHLE